MRGTAEGVGRFGRRSQGILLIVVVAAVLLAGLALPVQHVSASSYPCTEAGLNSAVGFGGSASFSCGGPTTITITSVKTVASSLTLDGGGLLTINGNNAFRVFTVNPSVTFNVQNLTITNGNSIAGAAIYNNGGTLNVTNSTLTGNAAAFGGGGIYNLGILSVTNSTLAGNTAPSGGGGGIYSQGNTLTVTNSIFVGNSAGSNNSGGGGIYSNGSNLSITNSTLAGNSANGNTGSGGGIYGFNSIMSVTNSTLAGNLAFLGGGGILNSGGNLSITNSTLSGNTASTSNGGGVNNLNGFSKLIDSLVVNNGTGGDLAGIAPNPNSHNLTGAFTFADASPAVPGAHGGPTATLALPFGSPAIDAGICNPTYTDAVTNATVTVTTDGRGVARPQGGGCDIGAFENQGVAFANLAGSGQAATVTTAFAQPLQATAVALDPGVSTGNIQVIFTAPAGGASGTFAPSGTTSATVTTSATGVATAPAFTANTAAGSYTVMANILAGGGVPARFDLTNTAGTAASITAISGNGGSAVLGSAFAAPLRVRAFDVEGNAAPNATVTFTPPTGTNVPTVTFPFGNPTATTDASGYASVIATASGIPGTLTVTAIVPGASTPASFGLTNIAAAGTLTLTGFSPPTGPITGGTAVTLHGTNLGSVTGVSFGGSGGTITASTATSLTVTTSAHAAGTVNITITTATQTATLHGYTYLDVGSIAPQPQPSAHPPAGNVVSGSGGIAPMAQPNRR